jgi:nitrate reductase gamma subunit
MNLIDTLAFVVFPYVALTLFAVGHLYRYVTDALDWNAHSSEFLENRQHFASLTLFHWGVLLTLFGHTGGLLIPQTIFDGVGIDGEAHTRIALYSGLLVGSAAFVGSVWLLGRRMALPRLQATTSMNDWVTLAGLAWVGGVGLYNVVFGHFYVLDTVAPWIRGIITLQPDPNLMALVPPSYKLHILSALALLAFSPFSRLVHIWSAPVLYLLRSPILYRRRATGRGARVG